MFKLALGSAIAGYAAAEINEDFQTILHGEEQLHATHLEPMWAQYKAEYEGVAPIGLDSEDAMFAFFANVDSIITHNTN